MEEESRGRTLVAGNSMSMLDGLLFAGTSHPLEAQPQAIEEQVDDRRRKQSETLRHDQSAHDRDAQWPAQLAACTGTQRQR